MSTDPGESSTDWSIGLAEDVDIPGWIYLPPDLDLADQETWVREVAVAVLDLVNEGSAGSPVASQEVVRQVLRAGLAARAASGATVLYQVWPVRAPAAVLCQVSVARTDDLPDWTTLPGRVHAADARHLGPGLQYSQRRILEDVDGPVEVSSVAFVFADTEHAVMLSLQESLSPLIAHALVPLGLFKDALTMTRADGPAFESVAPAGLVEDAEWLIVAEERS